MIRSFMRRALTTTALIAGAAMLQGCVYDPATGGYYPCCAYPAYGYGQPAYGSPGYGYAQPAYSYPAYGYDAYRYAAPVFRGHDDRRGWDHDRRDHGRR